jgi:methylmalonyl-CoA/ethylmalonyl-CoA epimerase
MIFETSASPVGAFDHVGVVVKSLELGRRHLSNILGVQHWTQECVDKVNGVRLVFGRDPAGIVHELLEPWGDNSPVAGSLRERRNLLNHLAYRVASLDEASLQLRGMRCFPTSEPKEALAFGGGRVQFFLTPLNVVYEMIEAPNHTHQFFSQGN